MHRMIFQLKLMSTLHQTQPTVQLLLSSNDYVGALDIIMAAQEMLTKELMGVTSFRYPHMQSLYSSSHATSLNVCLTQQFFNVLKPES